MKQFDVSRRLAAYLLIGGLSLCSYGIRLSGPTDLEGYAQNRNIGYVLDAVRRGNWLAQEDVQNRIMSKPPLHTWAAAVPGAWFGVNRLTLTLPSFIAVLGLALLVFETGRIKFGAGAGLAAGIAFLMNPSVAKHIALVRSDAMFALAVMLTALAGWRAWNRQTRNWTPFWLAAAAATLIKGPLGVVLGAAGLLAFFMERRSDPSVPRPGGSHGAGIALYLVICLGWFAAAFYQSGGDLFERMIVQELFGHSAGVRRGSFPLSNLPKPSLFFIGRFLPFSIPAIAGLWRVFKHPEADPEARRFERFLFCWFTAGLILFSLATHHRADLLLPLWPAAALLAGREMIRFRTRSEKPALLNGFFVSACAVMLLIFFWNYHRPLERREKSVTQSVEAFQAGNALKQSGLPVEELVHLNTPVTLQLGWGTFCQWTEPAKLVERLENGEVLQVVVADPEQHEAFLQILSGCKAEPVFRWPQQESGAAKLAVYRMMK